VLDVTKLRDLGWSPKIDLDTGIRTTYQWFLDEQAADHDLRGIEGVPAAASATDRAALITGITGQDGSYLAELLLDKGYEVHGLVRRTSELQPASDRPPPPRPQRRTPRAALRRPRRTARLAHLIDEIEPDEVYHLAAQSARAGELRDARLHRVGHRARHHPAARSDPHDRRAGRFYQASSSEMFGSAPPPQNENTPFHPRSPYAIAKVYAYWATINYREAYGMFASNGILFNHESPRRGENFVTRKITRGVADIVPGAPRSCISATSTPSVTGASPATTSTPCGACSNTTSPTTT
jgi:GDPmannose 4,6-dehydratase